MLITGHRRAWLEKGVGGGRCGVLIVQGGLSDILKHLKTKLNKNMEICPHGKTNMNIHRISEYCEKIA